MSTVDKFSFKTYPVKNVCGSAIMLPVPAVEPSDITVLPINGEMVVSEHLLALLGDLVAVTEHLPNDDPVYCVNQDSKDLSSGTANVKLEKFFKAWDSEYGDSLVQAKDLLNIAITYFQELQQGDLTSHRATIALGRRLKKWSQGTGENWLIVRVQKPRKSFYKLVQRSTNTVL